MKRFYSLLDTLESIVSGEISATQSEQPAIELIAALTFASGLVVALRMRETKRSIGGP
ncbi:MAG TPA: hypothetical protein VGV87_24245 [Blastocatellia bacterium]|nr:hypothetical protein [Blastocatellia bacterium]